ncbi:YjiH family protein [Allosaccharopolyspora coralli]|nr:YjiH family protein [Allosaccharopolyspora coralli]
MTERQQDLETSTHGSIAAPMWKFVVYSAIGAFVFFVPIEIGGESSILLDHMVTGLQAVVPGLLPYYALALILAGALHPMVTGTWRRSRVDLVFSAFKLVGLVVGVMLVFGVGPGWLFAPDMGPFLLNKLVVPVAVLVPLGAVFLALLVGYGLLEFIGVLVQGVMRPVWRTPGRSAIDAVASFVGSYSLGLLITNRVYQEGKYTGREAAIIATGFSTVSATFMVVVATTLDMMQFWNLYFWTALAVTFVVTAVTVRMWPLSSIADRYVDGTVPQRQEPLRRGRVRLAWQEARRTVAGAPSLVRNVGASVRDGVLMTIAIVPSILSIGLLGLVLATYTPVFEWLGYVFYPVTWALQSPEPMLLAQATAVGIVEMFLPSLLAAGAPMAVKFVVAVVSVSQIVFFSALVPCIAATRIPISITQLVVIWFERVVLSLILTIPLALWLF